MIKLIDTRIKTAAVHGIGSRSLEEGVKISSEPIGLSSGIKDVLQKYFLTSFKSNEYYNLHHESDLELNEVYSYVSGIFDDQKNFHKQSVKLAKHLYEHSTHPKIKGGELYVVYFTDCIVNENVVDAVGIFKSESKETYLKVLPSGDNFEINSEDGININKLDKGCLIFNTEREKGFLVAIVDNLSKGAEAQYWKDDFLHVRACEDNYHQTQNVLRMCKSFVTDKLPEDFNVTKADQVDLLNKSVKFFKDKDSFNFEDFSKEVIIEPKKIKAFKEFKEQFQSEKEINIANEFEISDNAVKKQSRIFKSVIKLDKNFHIYIHGNRENIVQGFDEQSGLRFYQIFYKEES